MSGNHIGICKLCGKESSYQYKSFVKDYCSHACSNSAKWDSRQLGETSNYKCQSCTKPFSMLTSTAKSRENRGREIKYCSTACCGTSRGKADRRVTKPCSQCGKSLARRSDNPMKSAFCSKTCSSLSQRRDGLIWSKHNPDKTLRRKYMRVYSLNNKSRKNELARKWSSENRPYRNYINALRRAAGTLTFEMWLKIITDADGKCAVCGSSDKPQVDHIVPVIRGGKTEPLNLQVLCRYCNVSKGAKVFESWLPHRLKDLCT